MTSILIADDNESTRAEFGAALEDAGYEVTYAKDGEQAVNFLHDTCFDVVVMELAMPVKNGLVAIKEILQDFPTAKIVAVTEKDPENLPVAVEYGAVMAINLPISPEQLVAAVRGAMDSDRQSGWGGASVLD